MKFDFKFTEPLGQCLIWTYAMIAIIIGVEWFTMLPGIIITLFIYVMLSKVVDK